ncbi:hypothetical protein [Streptomyces sp. NPDC090053]|uniref:hypothetical protein n=1 Tax=Streptomyces sp. NPDC090053 TaxID=3365932 RepID=UPI0037FBD59E
MTTDSADDAIPVLGGQGRTGQRVGHAVAWSIAPVLVVVPAVLVRSGSAGSGLCLLGLFALLAEVVTLYCVNQGWGVQLRAGGLLSCLTLTGRRTVDLTRLTKVGRFEIGGRGGGSDLLVLTDTYGVRAIVHRYAGGKEKVDGAVREALRNRTGATVVVSGRAAERLGVQVGNRPGSALRAGRSGSGALAAFLPVLLIVPAVVVSIGLLIVSLLLAGAL